MSSARSRARRKCSALRAFDSCFLLPLAAFFWHELAQYFWLLRFGSNLSLQTGHMISVTADMPMGSTESSMRRVLLIDVLIGLRVGPNVLGTG